jgi:DNA-binding response OmpR family regulator
MTLRTGIDQTSFESAHIQNIIHTRVESAAELDVSVVVLFIPTDTLQQLSEILDHETDDERFSAIVDVVAASILHQMRDPPQRIPLTFDGLMVDPVTRKALVGKNTLSLPRREFDLLWFLARHPRCVFTRSQLLDFVWGCDYVGTESTVTVHIRRLRKKIEPNPDQPIYLRTIWGVGYMFDPD